MKCPFVAALLILAILSQGESRAENKTHAHPCCHQTVFGGPDPCMLRAGPRGVFDAGARRPPAWTNTPPTVPTTPTQKTVVTYSFVEATEVYSTLTLNPIEDVRFIGANTRATLMEGIESWADVCGVILQNVPNNGQIRVGQGTTPLGPGSGYTWFQYSFNSSNTYMTSAAIVFNDGAWSWTANGLRGLAAHEVGHALGFTHSDLDGDAVMYPIVTVRGPMPDDRWYAQFLYGNAPAKLSGDSKQAGPVAITIGRASPRQTGTNSDPTANGGADLPWGPGTGTNSQTQNNVLRYVLERKAEGEADFSVLDSNVLASSGGQNADGTVSHTANQFQFVDVSATEGSFSYRVKAVLDVSGDDIFSDVLNVSLKASQIITFAPITDKMYGDAPFDLTASADSGLPVTFSVFSGPAAVAGDTVTILDAGNVTIRASQPGNANFAAAEVVERSFTVNKAAQFITFNQPPDITFGDLSFTLNAVSSSGLPVVFSVVAGPVSIVGDNVTATGAGSVTIRAAQPGDTRYEMAQTVERDFNVARAGQTITFSLPASAEFNSTPLPLNATASSGLAAEFSVISGPATVSNNALTLTGIGDVQVQAAQSGNANYNAADAVGRLISIVKGSQQITVVPIGNRIYPSAPFAVSATSSAGLPVEVTVLSGPATVDGSTVTLTGEGMIVLKFSQPGNELINSAADVTVSFYSSRQIVSAKVSGIFKFKVFGQDSVSISGVLPGLPQGFQFAGRTFSLNAGGIQTVFPGLDGKGRSVAAGEGKKPSTLALKLKFKKTAGGSQFTGGDVPFTAKLCGAFTDDLQLNSNVTVTKQSRSFNIDVILDNDRYFTVTANVILSAKANVGGAFRSK